MQFGESFSEKGSLDYFVWDPLPLALPVVFERCYYDLLILPRNEE